MRNGRKTPIPPRLGYTTMSGGSVCANSATRRDAAQALCNAVIDMLNLRREIRSRKFEKADGLGRYPMTGISGAKKPGAPDSGPGPRIIASWPCSLSAMARRATEFASPPENDCSLISSVVTSRIRMAYNGPTRSITTAYDQDSWFRNVEIVFSKKASVRGMTRSGRRASMRLWAARSMSRRELSLSASACSTDRCRDTGSFRSQRKPSTELVIISS